MRIHLNKIHFYLNRNLGLLYASQVIIGAARAFFSLFVPIFLYKELLFPLWLVLLIYGLQIMLYGLSIHCGYKLSLRFGVKKVFASGVVLNAIAIVFLLFAKENPLFIIPFSIFTILHWMLYYPASSIDEVLFTVKKARAREDSFIRAVGLGVNALIPLVSGFLIFLFGFNISFIIAIALSVLSAIPILYSKDKHSIGGKYSIKSSISFFKSYKNKKEFLAYIADGFKTGNLDLFWPIFVFIFIPSYVILGGITTIVTITSIILTVVLGQVVDRYGPSKSLKIGTYGEAISWFIKPGLWILATVTSFHILFVTITNNIMSIILGISMNKVVLDHADKKKTMIEFLFLQKFARQIGSSVPFLVFALLAFIMKNPEQVIILSFISMGLATLTFPFILTKKADI